jgi:hypothetical protein
MPLPSNPHFDDFVRGIRFTRTPDNTSVLYWSAPPAEALYLAFPAAHIALESVIRIIQRGLNEVACDSSRGAAIAILGAVAATCPDNDAPSEYLARLLDRPLRASLQMHVILPTTCARDYCVAVGDCVVQPFEPSRLLYWAQKGSSQYPIDVNGLRGRAAISQELRDLHLVDLQRTDTAAWARAAHKWRIPEHCIADAYFHAIFEHHLSGLPDRVRRATQVLEAGGLIYVDMQSLIDSVLSVRLGLFCWRAHSGTQRTWAVMNAQANIQISLPAQDRLTSCNAWLETQLGYTGMSPETALNNTLAMFCTLMQRGRRHAVAGSHDEAALYFVIAMDFLFGDDGRSTDSIAARAAVLTHRADGNTYHQQHRRIRELYDARSRYVHAGQAISRPHVAAIDRIATQILWCFLSVSADSTYTATDEWVKQIDFVGAATQAGRDITEADLRAIGVRNILVPPTGDGASH